MSIYEGDVLIKQTADGGEIYFNSGIIETTLGFESMVYLLLFGGNRKDDGTEATKKYEWWGNKLENNNPERKVHSRFQNILYGLPATPENIKKLEDAARQDLEVLKAQKIVDSLDIELTITEPKRVEIEIIGWKDESKLFETIFEANWKGMIE